MAVEHIKVDHSTRHGAKIRQTHNEQMAARSHLQELKDVMEPMIDGVNYTLLETEFGLPTGTGETTYNLISGALNAILTDSNLNQMLRRLG